MAIWMLGQIEVHDAEKYKAYSKEFRGILAQYQGELLCVGKSVEVLEGQWPLPRTVVIRFTDRESALKWYHSPEYQHIVAIRKAAATANIVLLENLVESASR